MRHSSRTHTVKHNRLTKKQYLFLSIICTVLVLLCAVLFPEQTREVFHLLLGDTASSPRTGQLPAQLQSDTFTYGSGWLEVLFVDVGQGDCILLKSPDDQIMMIDAGENANSDKVLEALKKNHISRIDVLVATHPHSDHIGAMRAVVNTDVEIGAVYMPDVIATTKTYEKLLLALEGRGLTVRNAQADDTIAFGSAQVLVCSPENPSSEDLNNASIVLHVSYGSISYLLTADAELEAIAPMMTRYQDSLQADVLKLGHHGSSTSISEEFLRLVSPQVGVITVGKDNDYGHPHREAIQLLKQYQIPVLRTDYDGDILSATDGQTLAFQKKPQILR